MSTAPNAFILSSCIMETLGEIDDPCFLKDNTSLPIDHSGSICNCQAADAVIVSNCQSITCINRACPGNDEKCLKMILKYNESCIKSTLCNRYLEYR
jgi:hypothetical protein